MRREGEERKGGLWDCTRVNLHKDVEIFSPMSLRWEQSSWFVHYSEVNLYIVDKPNDWNTFRKKKKLPWK